MGDDRREEDRSAGRRRRAERIESPEA